MPTRLPSTTPQAVPMWIFVSVFILAKANPIVLSISVHPPDMTTSGLLAPTIILRGVGSPIAYRGILQHFLSGHCIDRVFNL